MYLVSFSWQVDKKVRNTPVKSMRKHTLMQALSKNMKAEKKAKTNLGEGDGFETPLAGKAPTTPELAPETFELDLETSEPEPWPGVGVEVAVGVEHLMHSLRVGETGVSEGSAPDAADEVIVRFNSLVILSSMRIPRSLLVAVGKPMRNMRL